MSNRNNGKKPEVKNNTTADMNSFGNELKHAEEIKENVLNKKNTETSLLNQIGYYDENETNKFIQCVNSELRQQEQLKKILNETEIDDKQLKKVNNFISNNKIVDQLKNLDDVFKQFKQIYKENKDKIEKSEEILNIEKNKDNIELAEKMKELKKLKFDIANFLDENQIVSLYSHTYKK